MSYYGLDGNFDSDNKITKSNASFDGPIIFDSRKILEILLQSGELFFDNNESSDDNNESSDDNNESSDDNNESSDDTNESSDNDGEIFEEPEKYKMPDYKYVIFKDENDKIYAYHYMRVLATRVKASTNTYLRKHPHGTQMLELQCNPHMQRIHDIVKTQLNDKIICRFNDFAIKRGYTEKQLLSDITDIIEQYNN